MDIDDDLEQLALDVLDPAVEPRPDECLGHYLDRVLTEHGCRNDHRFTRRWAARRRRTGPAALVRWASRTGGCCCDCEVVLNSLRTAGARSRTGVLCAVLTAWQLRQGDAWWLSDEDDPFPEACAGIAPAVRPARGSTDLGAFE